MNRKDRRAALKTDSAAEANRLFAQAVAAHQAGRLKECVPLYRRVLALAPAVPEAHHNLGIALKGLDKIEEAVRCYGQAIALAPSYADAHNSLGNALSDLGRLEEAALSFQKAIDLAPQSAAAHNNLGTVFLDSGRPDRAETCFRHAIRLDQTYAEAHNNLGAALTAQGNDQEALAEYDIALSITPGHPRATANMAALLLKLERLDDALRWGKAAVELAPQSGHALNTLANALKALGRLEDAAGFYAQAVRAQPHLPELHDNLGNVLSQLGRSVEAERCCRAALALAPDFYKAHNNLGTALKDQGKRDEAEACFHKALELAPDMAAAHTNLGMALLYRGDFAHGWREFEWRWKTGKLAAQAFAQPRWTGDDPTGKTLLLTAEQGMGDAIQFARFAQPIAARGARVVLQVHRPLVRLLASVPGVAQAIAFDDAPPDFDAHLPLMSAPLALGTTLDSIPSATPYIRHETVHKNALPGLRVGLVWAGDPRPHDAGANAADRRRSIALAALSPLLTMPGCSFVSLQKGEAARQIRDLPADLRPWDPMEDVTDFSQTAAIVNDLDLVVGVDTSVVHLAGAMGKPVWILSRYDGCWRWLAGRDDSPWYPSARLFRQTRPGAWDEVIAALAQALSQLVRIGVEAPEA